MSAHATVIDLAGVRLEENSDLLRRHLRTPERRTENYDLNYDRTTLIYDAVRREDRGDILITAPPPMNLSPLIETLRDDRGTPVKVRYRDSGKYVQLHIPDPEARPELEIHGSLRPLVVRDDLSQRFASLNCSVTMNKNNPISWIQAWACHHVNLHGLQAVVIFDNSSTDYSAEDLAQAVSQVDGLTTVVVVRTPYPYGTTDKLEEGEVRPNFLQPAMLNLARTDLLRKARAVLNCDIDELVMRRKGASVFDRAARKPWRAVRMPVYWADAQENGPQPQTAHRFRAGDRVRTPRKWCVAPRGLMSRLGWYVHHVGGEAFKLNREDTDCEIVHCRATSTRWHPVKKRDTSEPVLTRDPELDTMMDALNTELKRQGLGG